MISLLKLFSIDKHCILYYSCLNLQNSSKCFFTVISRFFYIFVFSNIIYFLSLQHILNLFGSKCFVWKLAKWLTTWFLELATRKSESEGKLQRGREEKIEREIMNNWGGERTWKQEQMQVNVWNMLDKGCMGANTSTETNTHLVA